MPTWKTRCFTEYENVVRIDGNNVTVIGTILSKHQACIAAIYTAFVAKCILDA